MDNINFNEKKSSYSMFSAKEIPWHGLGTVVDGALTSSEAIKIANLDYVVAKGDLYIKYPEHLHGTLGKGKQHRGQYITYREDNGETFAVVGSKYEIVQNEEAFNFFDQVVGFKEAIFETAGALGVGETIFITAKLPKHIYVSGNDIIDRYLLFTNSHNGMRSIEVLFTPIRVVCSNTLQMAIRSADCSYKIRHTKSAHDKIDEAKNILGIENTMAENIQELYIAMTSIRVTDRQALGFINSMFLTSGEIEKLEDGLPYTDVISTRKQNTLEDIQSYYHTGPGQEMVSTAGTLWGVYNAVTGYYNNVKKYGDPGKKMESIMYGSAATKNNQALNQAANIVANPSTLEIYN
ncbi:hypothetical protein LCGC14_1904930 [marine sediment metagenome]|uniref:DUF945 domain-containing protein n=1 Tax=marine sediment metagenome TaxID=412755 RepID=A0A0F9I9D5_9ZZZZ